MNRDYREKSWVKENDLKSSHYNRERDREWYNERMGGRKGEYIKGRKTPWQKKGRIKKEKQRKGKSE